MLGGDGENLGGYHFFANEVEPTELALENSLYKLTGTLEQQYRDWRSILAELYALETQ